MVGRHRACTSQLAGGSESPPSRCQPLVFLSPSPSISLGLNCSWGQLFVRNVVQERLLQSFSLSQVIVGFFCAVAEGLQMSP